MALYAVIEGDQDTTAINGAALQTRLEDDEVIYVPEDDELDDETYERIEKCESVFVLGELEDDAYDQLDALADEVPMVADHEREGYQSLDPEEELGRAYSNAIRQAEDYHRAEQLRDVVSNSDDMAVVLHDGPDPDAISAGLAMSQIADHYSVEADIYHAGDVSHQENRALINRLDIELDGDGGEDLDLAAYDSVALVDTAPDNTDLLDPETEPPQVIIDHHQGWDEIETDGFRDIREDAGSTASIMFEYLDLLDIEPDKATATSLVHGIRSDTKDLDASKHEFTRSDLEALSGLYDAADHTTLGDIVNTTKTRGTARTLARAIERSQTDGATLFSYVGDVGEGDSIAQAADYLVDVEGIDQSIIVGFTDEKDVRISVRNRGDQNDAGEDMYELFGEGGEFAEYECTGGGHKSMAGAQIPFEDLGILAHSYDEGGDNEEFHGLVETFLEDMLDLEFEQ